MRNVRNAPFSAQDSRKKVINCLNERVAELVDLVDHCSYIHEDNDCEGPPQDFSIVEADFESNDLFEVISEQCRNIQLVQWQVFADMVKQYVYEQLHFLHKA